MIVVRSQDYKSTDFHKYLEPRMSVKADASLDCPFSRPNSNVRSLIAPHHFHPTGGINQDQTKGNQTPFLMGLTEALKCCGEVCHTLDFLTPTT